MLGERLKNLRNEKKKTQEEISKIIGMSRAGYSHLENERNEPDSEALNKLADYFDVTVDYLLGRTNDPKSNTELKMVNANELVHVPIVGSITCGPGGIIYQDLDGYSAFPKSDIDSSHEYVVLKTKGDSMSGDGIYDGDLALIQKEPDFVQGKIYAVVIDDEEVTLKRVTKTDDSIILMSSNNQYEPRIITGSDLDTVHIEGRLINIKRNFY